MAVVPDPAHCGSVGGIIKCCLYCGCRYNYSFALCL